MHFYADGETDRTYPNRRALSSSERSENRGLYRRPLRVKFGLAVFQAQASCLWCASRRNTKNVAGGKDVQVGYLSLSQDRSGSQRLYRTVSLTPKREIR